MAEKKKDTEKEWKEWGEQFAASFGPRQFERKARRGTVMFGLFLLTLGLVWLARDLGWIPSFPMWPVILILFGLYLVAGKLF